VADRDVPEAVRMIITDRAAEGEPSLCDHAFAVAKLTVAGCAVDLKSILASADQFLIDRQGELSYEFAVLVSGKERIVQPKMTPSDCSLDQGSRGHSIRVEVALLEWIMMLGLHPHIGVTSSDQKASRDG